MHIPLRAHGGADDVGAQRTHEHRVPAAQRRLHQAADVLGRRHVARVHHHQLVAPLIQSLAHPMIAGDLRLQEEAGIPGLTFRESIARALEAEALSTRPDVKRPLAYAAPRAPVAASRVRSVQRLPLPPGRDAAWVAAEYMRWLPDGLSPFLRVHIDGARVCSFHLGAMRDPLLVLAFSAERSAPDRQLFYITGGLLAAEADRGRFELRETPDGQSVLAAIHDFRPRLPWRIYERTQAIVHLGVMHAFGRHLARVGAICAA